MEVGQSLETLRVQVGAEVSDLASSTGRGAGLGRRMEHKV